MPSNIKDQKRYIEMFLLYQEFQAKKVQYKKAVHVFHDHTVEYNNVVDNLDINEMRTYRDAFNCREREFHDVMQSFDRTLEAFTRMIKKESMVMTKAVTLKVRGKNIIMKIKNGDMIVKTS